MRLAKQGNRGFTLVELMIVVAIVGVLAALAIYGVNKYVTNAKTTEARSAVARIAKDATTAYARPKMSGEVMAADDVRDGSNVLCTSATPVPAVVPKAQKAQSSAADWKDETVDAAERDWTGWQCLRFSMTDPQQYQYDYQSTLTTFSAIAKGDLDGDDALSTFTMKGEVQTDQDNLLFVSPTIIEEDPQE